MNLRTYRRNALVALLVVAAAACGKKENGEPLNSPADGTTMPLPPAESAPPPEASEPTSPSSSAPASGMLEPLAPDRFAAADSAAAARHMYDVEAIRVAADSNGNASRNSQER